MTNLTPKEIRDAIQQGLEETWRLIDSGKKIQLLPDPPRRKRTDSMADQSAPDQHER